MSDTVQKNKYGDNIAEQIINNYGLDVNEVKKLLSLLADDIYAQLGITAENVKNAMSDKLQLVLCTKLEEFICQINASGNAKTAEIKNLIKKNFESLSKDNNAQQELIKSVADDLSGLLYRIDNLSTNLNKVVEMVTRLSARYEWEASEKIAEEVMTLFDNGTKYIKFGYDCIKRADFEHAKAHFERVVSNNISTNEIKARAFFGLALAEGKIQLIWDCSFDQVLPICYDSSALKAFRKTSDEWEGSYIKSALDYLSDKEEQEKYEKFAKIISQTLEEFANIQGSSKGDNYACDCFICEKVTDMNDRSVNTEDCKWLLDNKIYDKLIKANIKPFFSEIDLKGVHAGTPVYNARLAYALSTAKLMILVCSKEEYLNTPWVKSEYSRFINILNNRGRDPKTDIIIVFDGKSINLPYKYGRYNSDGDFDRSVRNNDEKSKKIEESEKVNQFIECVSNRLKHITRYVDPNKKYCLKETCVHYISNTGYELNTFRCAACDTVLVDAVTFLNYKLSFSEQQRIKERAAEKEAKDAAQKREEQLKKELEKQKKVNEIACLRKKSEDAMSGDDIGIILADDDFDDIESLEEVIAPENCAYKIRRLYKAAKVGNIEAQYKLGGCYLFGKGVEENHEESFKWFYRAAHPNSYNSYFSMYSMLACWRLGCQYGNGYGVKQDFKRAVYWYRKAAEQGYSSAQFDMGICYLRGYGVEKDYGKAVHWLAYAAEQGDAAAQRELGQCYRYGRSVEKDIKKALELLHKAVKQGNAYAQDDLGWCYYNGEGVEKDIKRAAYWWGKSAEQGIASAQNDLGYCYYNGEGVEQDYGKAVYWYRKAIEQGNSDAQINLGECYYLGRGVEHNRVKAIELYREALDHGHTIDDIIEALKAGLSLTRQTLSDNEMKELREALAEQTTDTEITEESKPANVSKESKNGNVDFIKSKAGFENVPKFAQMLLEQQFEIDGTILKKCRGNSGNVGIPKGFTSIADRAFFGCDKINSITIPNSVTDIGNFAFWGCRELANITIPESVRNIGDHVFYDCNALTSIIFNGTVVEWKAIRKTYNDCSIVVHCTDGDTQFI